jgi:hypothetical protein
MDIIREHAYFEMSDWEQLCWRNFNSLDVVYSIHQINISIKCNYPINSDYHISLFHFYFYVQFNGFFIHNLFLETFPLWLALTIGEGA